MTGSDYERIQWDEPLLDVPAMLKRWSYTPSTSAYRPPWQYLRPWNIPGPVYVGDDDACGTGPLVAPNNVQLHPEGYEGEFIFRQPSSEYELRQVLEAAQYNPVEAYAFDGDARWTPETVAAWWEFMQPVRRQLRETITAFDEGIRRVWGSEMTARRTPELEAERQRLEKERPDPTLRRWLDYLDHGTERYLHRYIDFLRARRT